MRSSPTTAEGLWKRSNALLAASLPWNVTNTAAIRLSARTTVAWYSMAPAGMMDCCDMIVFKWSCKARPLSIMLEKPASRAESRRAVLNCSSHCESSNSRDWSGSAAGVRASSVLAKENFRIMEFMSLSGIYVFRTGAGPQVA